MKKTVCIITLSFFFILSLALPVSFALDDPTILKASSLYKKKRYRAAISLLKDYVDRNPHPEAYYILGLSYYKLRMYKKSKAAFSDVYLIEPNYRSETILAKRKKPLDTINKQDTAKAVVEASTDTKSPEPLVKKREIQNIARSIKRTSTQPEAKIVPNSNGSSANRAPIPVNPDDVTLKDIIEVEKERALKEDKERRESEPDSTEISAVQEPPPTPKRPYIPPTFISPNGDFAFNIPKGFTTSDKSSQTETKLILQYPDKSALSLIAKSFTNDLDMQDELNKKVKAIKEGKTDFYKNMAIENYGMVELAGGKGYELAVSKHSGKTNVRIHAISVLAQHKNLLITVTCPAEQCANNYSKIIDDIKGSLEIN